VAGCQGFLFSSHDLPTKRQWTKPTHIRKQALLSKGSIPFEWYASEESKKDAENSSLSQSSDFNQTIVQTFTIGNRVAFETKKVEQVYSI
jgi:hypothetical protein